MHTINNRLLCHQRWINLTIRADFDKFQLEVFFEKFNNDIDKFEDIDDDTKAEIEPGIIGIHQAKDINELSELYDKLAYRLFDCEFEDFEFRDMSEDYYKFDLKQWYKINSIQLDEDNMSPLENFALDLVRSFLPKLKEGTILNNLAFYWSEDHLDYIYYNSTKINGIDENELKNYIQNNYWLDGSDLRVDEEILMCEVAEYYEDVLEVVSFSDNDYDKDSIENYMRNIYGIEEDDELVRVERVMYMICAILETKKCFGLIEIADDFRAFNISHDGEQAVDFVMRDRLKTKFAE